MNVADVETGVVVRAAWVVKALVMLVVPMDVPDAEVLALVHVLDLARTIAVDVEALVLLLV